MELVEKVLSKPKITRTDLSNVYKQIKQLKLNISWLDLYRKSTRYDSIKELQSKLQINKIDKEEKDLLVRAFNESAAIGFLPPLRDAIHYVRKLHEEHGYVFRVITSLSLNKHAGRLRQKNLFKLFGTAIDDVLCLDTGADKDEALAPYKDSGLIWIEDKPENADLGAKLGLTSYLIEHKHNMNHDNNDVTIVKNWKELYELIT